MKNLILAFALLLGAQTFAQGMGDITIYSNTGNKFYVILNGIRQNNRAETNVKVTGLTNPWYDCKIMSENNNFTIEKKIPVKYDTLITFSIEEKKGKYKLRYLSETPLGTATAVKDQEVVTYHSTETPINTNQKSDETVNVSTNNTSTTGVVSTTTTTTSTTTRNDNLGTSTNVSSGSGTESINMNISINENGTGADINMNVTGTGDPNAVNTTTTTTNSSTLGDNGNYEESTTFTSTSSGGTGTTYYEETTTTTTTTTTTGGTFGSSNGTVDERNMYEDNDMTVSISNSCYVSDDEVDGIAKQIANESFSDDQSRIGNMTAENKCMNTAQIIKVANSFTFEDNKLEFLKKAYNNCTDQSNYYKVMETLTFSGDKEELQNYINAR